MPYLLNVDQTLKLITIAISQHLFRPIKPLGTNPTPNHGIIPKTLSSYSPQLPPHRTRNQSSESRWNMAVICDWPYKDDKDLRLMARDIAKAARLPFTPHSSLLEKGEPCSSARPLSQAEKVVTIGSIPSQGIIVTVNKWVWKVNTFDSMITDFEGWINIRGLSFNIWNIPIKSGTCVEAWKKSTPIGKIFLNLFEAKIKVKATRAVEVPLVVYQKVEDEWIPIQHPSAYNSKAKQRIGIQPWWAWSQSFLQGSNQSQQQLETDRNWPTPPLSEPCKTTFQQYCGDNKKITWAPNQAEITEGSKQPKK